MTFELTTVFLYTEFLTFLDHGRCGEVPVISMIFRLTVLTDFYHAQPMTSGLEPGDESDNILACKPTVSQHIVELDLMPDGTSDHLHGKCYLGLVIFHFSLPENRAVMPGNMTTTDFLYTHTVVSILAFLSQQTEVKKKLGDSIGYAHTETFESENTLVGEMGMYPAYFLNGTSGLFMVGIVKNETHIPGLVVRTNMYAVPKLHRYMPHGFTPTDLRIVHEPVENILAGFDHVGQSPVLMITPDILNPETRKQEKTLEYRQKRINTIRFTPDRDGVPFSHLDCRKYIRKGIHRSCHIRIIEKSFDFREKWGNFAYRHGYEYVLGWYLKLLIFCQIGKKPCRFFMPLSQEYLTCET